MRRTRLHVDPDQLQEGDQREAGGEHPGAVAKRFDVLGVEHPLASERGPEDGRGCARSAPARARSRRRRPRRVACSSGRGKRSSARPKDEPALAARPLQLLQRVAALAHPCDHPGLGGGGGGPAPPAHRHDLLLRPALQGVRRDPGAARGLAQGDPLFARHGSQFALYPTSQRPAVSAMSHFAPVCGASCDIGSEDGRTPGREPERQRGGSRRPARANRPLYRFRRATPAVGSG